MYWQLNRLAHRYVLWGDSDKIGHIRPFSPYTLQWELGMNEVQYLDRGDCDLFVGSHLKGPSTLTAESQILLLVQARHLAPWG